MVMAIMRLRRGACQIASYAEIECRHDDGQAMTTAIGNTIKAARIARGLTLQNVAESLGLRSRQQIYEWESGRVCPGPKHLAKLADVLGLQVTDLLPQPNHNRPAEAGQTGADMTSPITAAHAHRLMLAANNRFASASHRFVGSGVDRYAEAHIREIQAIVDRATACVELVEVFPNGLRKFRSVDAAGAVVSEWTDGPAKTT